MRHLLRVASPPLCRLGRRLFYDADLSVDGTLSCASCHEQHRAFADGNATHPGVKGAAGRRNVMGLANVAYLSPLTWADPAQTTLEAQVAAPVTGDHPVEMGMRGQEAEIVRRLGADACYRAMFAAAFPETRGEITFGSTADAIGAFERTLVSWNSPYDRHFRGDRRALSDTARRGAALFRAQGCSGCHAGPNFTDGRFHAVVRLRGDDQGLAEKTAKPADRGKFRTPNLRNAELTGPYLHDGSARTIPAAIFAAHPGRCAPDRSLPGQPDRSGLRDEPRLRAAHAVVRQGPVGVAGRPTVDPHGGSRTIAG